MPCINVTDGGNGMGIGRLGAQDVIHKRKFRWVLDVYYCNFRRYVPGYFVKTAGRPSISIEETEINFLNEKTWVPGKAAWEQITITYYDVATTDFSNTVLLSWLATIYDFTDRTCRHMASRRSDYTGAFILTLLDGCGNALETWAMSDAWTPSIKFGDLDMSSNEVCDIELTTRYSQVSYINHCGGGQVERCPCTPCGNSPVAVETADTLAFQQIQQQQ